MGDCNSKIYSTRDRRTNQTKPGKMSSQSSSLRSDPSVGQRMKIYESKYTSSSDESAQGGKLQLGDLERNPRQKKVEGAIGKVEGPNHNSNIGEKWYHSLVISEQNIRTTA